MVTVNKEEDMDKAEAQRLLDGYGGYPLSSARVAVLALAECEQTAREQGYDGDDWQPTLEDLEYVEAQMRAHAYRRRHVADKTR